mgnify:CR=1 FL=1
MQSFRMNPSSIIDSLSVNSEIVVGSMGVFLLSKPWESQNISGLVEADSV